MKICKKDGVITFEYPEWGTNYEDEKYKIYARKTFNENSVVHRHNYIEFFYVTEGNGLHVFNKNKTQLETGEACLLIPSDVHGFIWDGKTDFHHIDIMIELKFFKEYCNYYYEGLFNDILKERYERSFKLSAEQIHLFNRLVPCMFLPPDNFDHIMASKVLLTSVINIILGGHIKKSGDDSPDWLVTLLTAMNTSSNFTLSVHELTQGFAYNTDYMRRIFKKNLGTTMTDYFNRKKIDYAYRLLQITDYSIEKICELIGINNISHFYHLFKEIYNKTPNTIRKS